MLRRRAGTALMSAATNVLLYVAAGRPAVCLPVGGSVHLLTEIGSLGLEAKR